MDEETRSEGSGKVILEIVGVRLGRREGNTIIQVPPGSVDQGFGLCSFSPDPIPLKILVALPSTFVQKLTPSLSSSRVLGPEHPKDGTDLAEPHKSSRGLGGGEEMVRSSLFHM